MLSHIGTIQPLDAQQLNKLNEALASLNAEQKIWLSGYLAGQTTDQLSGSTVTTLPQANVGSESSLTVLYGSQTGNARSLAQTYFQAAKTQGIAAKLISLAEFKPRQITKEHNVVLLVSTHGEGDAPDDAEIFHEYLFSKKAPKLNHLSFSVLALGDSSYEKFCQTGVDFDQQLEKLGAKRIAERVDCDLDFEEQAKTWQQQTLRYFKENLKQAESHGSNVVPITSALNDDDTTYNRANPFAAEILTLQRITTDHSIKVVYHVELSLEGSNLSYQPGDGLGIFANNRSADVQTLIGLLQLDAKQTVQYQGEASTIEKLLTEVLEISLLNKKFLAYYADQFGLEALSKKIKDHEQFTQLISNRQLIDIFTEFPAVITAQELVDHLPKITPRMYSIASSLQTNPEEVHLTIALVNGNEGRNGLVSGALCNEFEEGDLVNVFIEPNNHFKLPQNPQTPIIMIGPGTGVAPFRSFLQERQITKQSGDTWLFFGNPSFDHDFLYQLEWQQFIADGTLNHIDLAFSRDQTEKIYVQQRIKEQAETLWLWLEKGAHIYICGNKDRMAKDVESELLNLIEQHGQLDAEQAQDYLKTLKRDKRYQKDVY